MQQNTAGLPSFPPSISEGSLRGKNVNICSFVFTENGGIAQISNVHLLSRQVSSGQRISFADLLLVQYSVPVFDASPERLPLLTAAEEPGAHIPTHCPAMGSSPTAEGREGCSRHLMVHLEGFICLHASATTT